MKKIPMVDLRAQHRPVRKKIRRRINRIMETCSFIQGGEVADFEKRLADFLGSKYVISCASGTDALQIALMALELEHGDEILMPAFTFVSAAEVIRLLGLKPVLVDIDPGTFCMDAEKAEQAVTPRTKAIIPTHLFGQCCDMNAILEIADRHGLFVIEDACQAIGAEFYCDYYHDIRKKAGTMGHIGCFSFFPSKNLGCYGDGGALCTDSDELAEKMRIIARHGSVVKYNHKTVGVNSRLDSVQAAVLNAHLPRLPYYNRARKKAADRYDAAFVSCMRLKVPERAPYSTHIFHQYCLICRSESERYALKFHLENAGIATAIYYPIPIHLQEAYADLGYQPGDFPVAEDVCSRILAIPMHPFLKKRQIRHITRTAFGFFA